MRKSSLNIMVLKNLTERVSEANQVDKLLKQSLKDYLRLLSPDSSLRDVEIDEEDPRTKIRFLIKRG